MIVLYTLIFMPFSIIFVIPHAFIKSDKWTARLCQPFIVFFVDLSNGRDGASLVGELMDCLQLRHAKG